MQRKPSDIVHILKVGCHWCDCPPITGHRPPSTINSIGGRGVLDDVLVGLDYANHRPLLAVLEKHFPDWKIVLLTHDRHWFEVARRHADRSLDVP